MYFIKVLHKIMRRACLQNWFIKKHQLSLDFRYALQRDLLSDINGILIDWKLTSCVSN
jgi:hypothetical protein